MHTPYNPKRRHWPHSAAQMNQAMGGYGTWASAWLCDEASGNLADRFSSITLAAASTPTYGNKGPMPGARAVGFDSAADRFVAANSATFEVGGAGSVAIYACLRSTAAATDAAVCGKIDAAGENYWLTRCENTSGHLTALVRSAAGTPVVATLSQNHCDGLWHDVLFFPIDRTANLAQVVSDLGGSSTVDTSGIGNVTSAPAVFAVGQQPAIGINALAMQIGFLAIATADVANLRTNAASAIASMRKFTRRA